MNSLNDGELLKYSDLANQNNVIDPETLTVENCLRQSIQLISWFPVLIAYAQQAKKHYHGNKTLFIRYPEKNLLHQKYDKKCPVLI